MCFSGFHPRRSPWLSLLLLWVCVCATVLQKGIKVNEVHPPPFCSEMKETSLSGHSLCVIDMRARACSSEHMLTPEVWEKCLFPFIFLIVKPDRAWMSWIDDPMFMFTLSPQHVLLWCSIKRKSEETKYRRSIWESVRRLPVSFSVPRCPFHSRPFPALYFPLFILSSLCPTHFRSLGEAIALSVLADNENWWETSLWALAD